MRGEIAQHDQSNQIVLHLTLPELLLLAGSVNEAIEAVEDWEFSTRLGTDKANARALRGELDDLNARREEMQAGMRELLSQLDGSRAARVAMLAGMTREELEAVGGVAEDD